MVPLHRNGDVLSLLRTGIVVAGVGAAAYAAHRALAGSSGSDPEEPGLKAALSELAGRGLPCDVEGEAGGDAAAVAFASQARALARSFGALPGGAPRISPRCAAAWVESWLEAWAAAHRADRERYRVLSGAPTPVTDFEPAPGAWRSDDLATFLGRNGPRSPLGRAWDSLRLHFLLASNVEPSAADQPWVWSAVVFASLRDFAGALDAASVNVEPNLLTEGLRRATRTSMRVVGWAVESAVLPVLGEAVSATLVAIGPYALAGLAGYLVIRRFS